MKKLLIFGAIGFAAWYFLLRSDNDDAGSSAGGDQAPTNTGGVRELTDAEARNYLKMNPDIAAAPDKGGKTDIEFAKWHWFNFGNKENRPSPYLS